MRAKLNPRVERKQQFHAYELYRDLGIHRSRREVARQIGVTPNTICKWAKLYKWDERIAKHNTSVVKRETIDSLEEIDDPITKKLVRVVNQMEALIDSAFTHEKGGKWIPQIKIKDVDEAVKLMAEFRRFVETCHKLMAEHRPAGKEEKRTTTIEEFNLYMGALSQEERISMMKGFTHGDEPGGDKQSPGGIQEADFEQVSGRGDEDGLGCDGVSGSPESSSSGDEGTMRES